jgi:hypothetical protein
MQSDLFSLKQLKFIEQSFFGVIITAEGTWLWDYIMFKISRAWAIMEAGVSLP